MSRILPILLLLSVGHAAVLAAESPAFVGGEKCASCHRREADLWRGSDHDLAMQPATAATILGNFDGAQFEKDGVTSTFFQRDGRYFVRTDGPDGALHEYAIAYVFGFRPLQQYLIEFPGGRFQALALAWDTRPAADGGQRWFHLYPHEKIDSRDVLHWTGALQNWNDSCAECHSTNLQKNYHVDGDRYETSWSEIDVSCEACHGPGSRHVEGEEKLRASTPGPVPSPIPSAEEAHGGGNHEAAKADGLPVHLDGASEGSWVFAPGEAIAHRTKTLSSRTEVETCGRCHSRRAQIWGEYRYGEPLAQTHRVALLDESLYFADGQIEDEDYEYGSFLQSKMYAAGVTCSNCHDPHSLKLRAAGNAVCEQCHLPAKFDSARHHFHKPNTEASKCVSCHMAERYYMVVDRRRDHSMRVPRPDLSEKLGTPNACNDCHKDKSARWAAEAVVKWYGPKRSQQWNYAEALHAGRSGRADAESQLVRAIGDPSVPPIARATAVSLLVRYLSPRSQASLAAAAGDADPLVRRAAAETVAAAAPGDRLDLGFRLLGDPIRSVRLEALGSLLDVPRSALSPGQSAAIDDGIREYRQAQQFNADHAAARANLGMLETRLDNADAARTEFETAIRKQPTFMGAYIGLADLERRQGREAEAEAVLRRALAVDPNAADVREALGMSLVRQKRVVEALPELAKAAELRPDVAQYTYVQAVALHDTGDVRGAIALLARANERHPTDRDILVALVQYESETRNRDGVVKWARKLVEVSDDPQARQLLEQLERAP